MMGYSAVSVGHTVPFYGSISYEFKNAYTSHYRLLRSLAKYHVTW